MKVKELIELLSKLDQEKDICIIDMESSGFEKVRNVELGEFLGDELNFYVIN